MSRVAWLMVVGGALWAAPATGQETYAVGGDDVAIYNLAGEVSLMGSSGDEVTVTVDRGGSDASELDVQVGEVDGRQTLRVVYPADRIHYDAGRWGGSTTLRVRSDGTWGRGDGWFGDGDRVRVSSRGGGMDAYADLRVGVPRGHRIAIHLAVGRIMAENVDGRVLLDTHAGAIEAREMAGMLGIDTGSGSVEVVGMDGPLEIDTGSGGVHVSAITGERLEIDTGSGSVVADAVSAERILVDTGSGGIRIGRSAARDVRLDTGSGSVEADLVSEIDRLTIDTGSGGVTVRLPADLSATVDIETGSGGIDVDFPVMVTRRSRDELHGRIGDGRGSIEIDTGSGGIRIRRQ